MPLAKDYACLMPTYLNERGGQNEIVPYLALLMLHNASVPCIR